MNRAILRIVSTLGIGLAFAGMVHGVFEIMQGNTATSGLVIQAIGDAQQNWYYGTEDAFTLLPTYLSAGILTNLVSLLIMIWSILFLNTKHAATVFLLLFILLFLVGGGIAQVVFFLPAWGVATRINKPLIGWRKLPERIRKILAPLWPVLLAVGVGSFLIGLFISVSGNVPWVNTSDPDKILSICWTFIFGGGWFVFLLTFICGFAHDAQAHAWEAA